VAAAAVPLLAPVPEIDFLEKRATRGLFTFLKAKLHEKLPCASLQFTLHAINLHYSYKRDI
jgi:hypothetical protein